ncbi:MAG: hypothetical protein CVT47_02935 [Thermoplasmata archaeon HGW-Thermoplasmata-2]|nr:MAG: hypothetical protein CVT47_02935 [Thermoplasmata archaeon HGW-Thermoplasmata-2]
MKEKGEFTNAIQTIFKPMDFWKIVAILLPLAYILIVLLTAGGSWDLSGLTYFLASMLLMGFVVLCDYALFNFFNQYSGSFERKICKGFKIVFIAGIIYFAYLIVVRIVFIYYHSQIASAEQMRTFFETYSSVANIVGIAILVMNAYGAYLLITALKHYRIKIARLKSAPAPAVPPYN